ncbi:hypothetical protein NP233_g5322 [Leucocoprinus birnbaumii]|uniref:Uncharacterized protein n=1 Tax=Leucocoprinus birnbaumii TaxID=56174 RepID=A0AAD5VT31_9AGAR|nr:hypothetical protein NP233_g5322 [Leucocoprinus birnbaumii]
MISSLNNHLDTNYPPTPVETQTLQQAMSVSNQRLIDMQSEIRKVEERLQDLTHERDALSAKVNSLQGILSPVRRLLPEILQEIFIHCLPVGRAAVMTAKEAPLLLGRSSIHIAVPSDSLFVRMHSCSHDTRTTAITEWLSRTGARPLSISIFISYFGFSPSDQSQDATIELYLRTISPFLPRCHSVSFSSSLISSWKIFLQVCAESTFPLLERAHLDLRSTTMDNAGEGEELSQALRLSPLLTLSKPLAISMPDYGIRIAQLPLQWDRLVVLNLFDDPVYWDYRTALSIADAVFLLSWCTNLAFCSIPITGRSISSHGLGSGSSHTPTLVSLPNMIGFSVRCDSDPKLFFLRLSTPSLRNFRYHQELPRFHDDTMNGEDRALHRSIAPFIRRVIHSIDELQLLVTYLTPHDAVQCLKLFPGLKRLSLLGYGSPFGFGNFLGDHVATPLSISERIIKQFITGRGEPSLELSENSDIMDSETASPDVFAEEHRARACLCPRLEVLSVQGASFSDTLMLELIRTRMLPDPTNSDRNDGLRLRQLIVSFTRGCSAEKDTLEQIEKLKGQSNANVLLMYDTSPTIVQGNPLYSPYNGLISVNYEGGRTYTYLPFFGPMLASINI